MRFLLVAALFFSVSLAAACQRSASDGTTWDLSSLVKRLCEIVLSPAFFSGLVAAGSSYRIQDSTYSYEFNICEDMTSTAVPRCQSALPAAVIQLYSYWCTKLGVTKQETVRPLKDASGQTTGVNAKIREYPVDSCMFEACPTPRASARLTGLEMIPCWGAIKALPGLVWDGIKATFTLSLCRSGYSRI
ncbi:hypothetical protein PAPYR_2189 [Paratrimastix pyriformis]|uniref:Uncharacterized protein n=1 Tax=Paratrimastix pyriformis TaxID=342808 RepID=A0ABQ8URW7_9EUKA|nr:hypothetical protein PAPYR_2189 [Paratrimastix pyriformis]